MSRSRTRALVPLWLLLLAALLLAGAVAVRSQLLAPAQHQVRFSAPDAIQPDGAPAQARSQSQSANEIGAARPASQPQGALPARLQVPSEVLLEAKGAQRQPPASQTCGQTAMPLLEICPDE